MEGFNDASTNRMALRRINIPRDESFSFFLAKISGVWALLKRLQLRGWAARGWKPRRYKKVAPAVMES
jgi:hypothetical protein